MRFTITWDGKVMHDFSKSFDDMNDGYKEIVQVLKETLEEVRNEETKVEDKDK